ncbi:MAG: hypothetical protein ACI8UO_000632 [Verrucomicrobiales bacterium]|jgi:hypothetical protein
MKIKNYFSILLAGSCLAFGASSSFAQDLLSEDDLNLKEIKSLFDSAFIKSEIDEDGDLKIEDGGLKTFITVDEEKMMITYFSIWPLRAGAPEMKKLQLVNSLNDDLIVVRYCMPKPTTLWCDYQVLYEGGITPYSIINNYRTFVKVVKGTASSKDPDDLIGTDEE